VCDDPLLLPHPKRTHPTLYLARLLLPARGLYMTVAISASIAARALEHTLAWLADDSRHDDVWLIQM